MDQFALVFAYLAVVNLTLFIMMGSDKQRARKRERRIPEKRLWTAAVIGGAAGGWIGMYTFRHKTKHQSFRTGFPLLTVVHVLIIGYFLQG